MSRVCKLLIKFVTFMGFFFLNPLWRKTSAVKCQHMTGTLFLKQRTKWLFPPSASKVILFIIFHNYLNVQPTTGLRINCIVYVIFPALDLTFHPATKVPWLNLDNALRHIVSWKLKLARSSCNITLTDYQSQSKSGARRGELFWVLAHSATFIWLSHLSMSQVQAVHAAKFDKVSGMKNLKPIRSIEASFELNTPWTWPKIQVRYVCPWITGKPLIMCLGDERCCRHSSFIT